MLEELNQQTITLRRLDKTFSHLMYHVGFEDITVTKVTQHAKVSRTAFYSYYNGIDEMYLKYARKIFDQFIFLTDRTLSDPSLPYDKELYKSKLQEGLSFI